MAFFPLSAFFEFVVLIGIGFVLMHEVGILPKLLATFLFISGMTVAIGKQYFIVEATPGVLSLVTPFGYPTIIVGVLIWLHLVLGYWGAAVIFRTIGRDMIGRKQLPKD